MLTGTGSPDIPDAERPVLAPTVGRRTGVPATHRHRPRNAFANTALVSIAVAVGTWLGATAPSVSPVTPAPPVAIFAAGVPSTGGVP